MPSPGGYRVYSLVRPGILPNSSRSPLQGWSPTMQCITTVIGDHAKMMGTRALRVMVGSQQTQHQLWLANIQDPCTVGLNLLDKWGALVYMSRATLSLGTETMVLHESSDLETPTQASEPTARTASLERTTPPWPSLAAEPPFAPQPQTMKIKGAINDLFERSCQNLNREQQQSSSISLKAETHRPNHWTSEAFGRLR